jgi:hypothetical protein
MAVATVPFLNGYFILRIGNWKLLINQLDELLTRLTRHSPICFGTSDWASQVLYSSSSHLIKPAEPPLLSLTRPTPSGITPTDSKIILHQSYYTDQTTPPLLLLRHWRSLKAFRHLHHRIALTQHSNNATRWQ